MKTGLEKGNKKSMQMTVSPEMTASFAGRLIHPVLSTVAMVYHMEWVGRLIIEPFLEENEEGIGVEIQVKHCLPAPVGVDVVFEAEVMDRTDRQVTCRVTASHEHGIVGEGEFIQRIVSRKKLYDKFRELS
ncbi:Predicted thioesterase [Thermoactinomyces sp. DSM 45891]|uniref:thioesterase family protein n=1 Tax=Thermoactinomyces sp. DSM 45891 TaxID=1761907 RepID=UPI00091C6419|nr:thioesterase [Thermoactinomyces sp. DSM 45891]SFX57693.1 Predicted thioesterase [Thermoactinomyces sp. DSM 45891]